MVNMNLSWELYQYALWCFLLLYGVILAMVRFILAFDEEDIFVVLFSLFTYGALGSLSLSVLAGYAVPFVRLAIQLHP